MSLTEINSSPINESETKKTKFIYGVLCVIGASLINFVYPSIFAFDTLAVYQTSYIKHHGGDADISYTMFYYPVLLLFQSIFGLIAGIIFSKIGVHWTNLLGTALFVLAGFIIYFSNRFYLDMISSAISGIAVAILMFPSTTNACKYFMNHIGLVNGIVETAISLGSSFYSFLGEQLINPDEIPSDSEDHLYNEEIAEKVKLFILIQIFSSIGIFIIEEMMTKTYKENFNEKFSIKFIFRIEEIKSLCNKKNKVNITEIENEQIELCENDNKEDIEIKDNINNSNSFQNIKKTKTRKEKIKIVLKSWKFWRFNLISLSQSPISDMVFAMYRGLGEYYQVNQTALQLIGTLTFIIEFILSFVFGVLCDYVDFKILLCIMNMIGTIVGITYYFSFQSSFGFTFLTLLISVQSAAYYSLKDYYLMKVYGTDIYIDISGIVCLFTGICVIILTFITYWIEEILNDKDTAYMIMFPVFGVFNYLGVILGFFEEDEPFDYGE